MFHLFYSTPAGIFIVMIQCFWTLGHCAVALVELGSKEQLLFSMGLLMGLQNMMHYILKV